MQETVKRYKNYKEPQKCGIRCRQNYPCGEFELHRHDYIEIEYIYSGEMEHELGGCAYNVQRGDCYSLNCHDLHRFKVGDKVAIRNVCIDSKNAPEAVRRLLFSVSLPMTGSIPKDTLPFVDEIFSKLYELINSDATSGYSDEKITAYTLLFLSFVFENSSPVAERAFRSGFSHVSKAMAYIEKNYREPITLSEVAEELHLSPNHFSKIFLEVSGVNFSEHLASLRINAAMKALSETDKAVTDIAFDSGYSSFASFSRNFKRIVGTTPSLYRLNSKTHK